MAAVPGLRALSVKFALVLFGVTAGALAIVYLAVVPQLESRLVDAKIAELERASPSVTGVIGRTNPLLYQEVVGVLAANANARVVVFDDTGHTVMVERPSRFNALLGQFIAGRAAPEAEVLGTTGTQAA